MAAGDHSQTARCLLTKCTEMTGTKLLLIARLPCYLRSTTVSAPGSNNSLKRRLCESQWTFFYSKFASFQSENERS